MSIRTVWRTTLAAVLGLVLLATEASAEDRFIIVQSTTSTQNSGLFDHLLPIFRDQTGIEVRVVAVGTGQALKNGRNCDGDVVFVHARPAEEQFVADGFGVKRLEVMYNDFVLVGPASDPAGVKGSTDVAAAMKAIADKGAPFASRGDDSGTHQAELALWEIADVDPAGASGSWYRETGSGMGPTLNTAAGMDAYVLTDRGSWIAHKNRGDLAIVVEGDDRLFNQYGVMLVSSDKCPSTKADMGQAFIDWVTGAEGQKAIAGFKLEGEQLFFPNAGKGEG